MTVDRSPYGGVVFFSPLNRRQRLARRRLMVVSAVIGLALAGALIGAFSAGPPSPAVAGGQSYLSSE